MADSRINSTSSGQYDLLLAVSQDSLNQALLSMWDIKGDAVEKMSVKNRLGSMDATITQVQAQILADGFGRGGVLMKLTLGSGNATLPNSKDEDVHCTVHDWKICFRADIALNNLNLEIKLDEQKLKDSNALTPAAIEEVKARLKANQKMYEQFSSKERAQDYSIERLFVDLANADISGFVKAETELPNLDNGMTDAFCSLLSRWLAVNKGNNKTILGYNLSVQNQDLKNNLKVADVLIPSSLNFNTYGYKQSPDAPIVLGWSGQADNNCLVYCNMTENRKVQGETLLQWSGNFTTSRMEDKATRTDGSLLIRRELFLDKFIIPILKQYNDDMQIVPSKMQFKRDGGAGDRRYHWTWDAVLGYNSAHPNWQNDPYFDFQAPTANATFGAFANPTNRSSLDVAKLHGFDCVTSTPGISWSWEKTETIIPPDLNEDWEGIIKWTDHLGGGHFGTSSVNVIPVPGSNRIKIRGLSSSRVHIHGYYTRLKINGGDLNYEGNIVFGAHWQVDIAIYAEDGIMKCKEENRKVFVFEDIEAVHTLPDDLRGDDFQASMGDKFPKTLESKTTITNAINDALNASGRFTHPAAGSFNFQNPVFNNRGDLLASVRYNALDKRKFLLPQAGKTVEQPKSDPSALQRITGNASAALGKKQG